MWKEGIAVLFVTVFAVIILYPSLTQVAPGAQEPAANNSTFSTISTVSTPPTTSADYATSTPSAITGTATTQGQFDSAWISQFISTINTYRGNTSLAPCAHLDGFASLRFQTLMAGTNWEIIHYGYNEDLQQAYGGTAGSYAEEYFFPVTPTYRSPGGFANVVQTNDPGHWSDLVNPLYRYFGVYTGTGPVLLFPRSCYPPEFTAGINQTQVPSGCHYSKVNGTWFIVELANTCV